MEIHSYNSLACTRGIDGTGISDTVRCMLYINSFMNRQLIGGIRIWILRCSFTFPFCIHSQLFRGLRW